MIENLSSLPSKMQNKSPEYCMRLLNASYSGGAAIVPQPNKYYAFVYVAKTRGIEYDRHPVIQCGNVYKWGFTGDNVHTGTRQYTWREVRSILMELSDEEFKVVSTLPLAKYVTN